MIAVAFVTTEFQVLLTLDLVLSFFFFLTDNSVYLSPKGDTPFGIYSIPISVIDNGGRVGENQVTVNLCDCVTPTECNSQARVLPGGNVTLGVWAILAMILGSLLLLCKYAWCSTMKCKTLNFKIS